MNTFNTDFGPLHKVEYNLWETPHKISYRCRQWKTITITRQFLRMKAMKAYHENGKDVLRQSMTYSKVIYKLFQQNT